MVRNDDGSKMMKYVSSELYFKILWMYHSLENKMMTYIHYCNCFIISTIVAPGNLVITASISMEVYNSPLKFGQVNHEI